jgi:hypothetical protein
MFKSVEVKELSKCHLCGGRRVRHIVKEGARYHVFSWSLMNDQFGKYSKTECSEKDCETNHGYGRCVPRKEAPKSMCETKVPDILSIRTALSDRDKLTKKEILDELEAYCNDEENIIYEDHVCDNKMVREAYLSQKGLLNEIKKIRDRSVNDVFLQR